MVRRRAKAINFGIIYGISAFGLANQLGIGREEAGDYIRTYFKRFPGIRDYMEATKQAAREQGYVETIFGRRMHFPRIKSPNPSERAFLERAAINAPIQGAAADIIRRAMIRMPDALKEAGLAARMLLQVHDELIFECPDAEAEKTMELVKRVMIARAGARGEAHRAPPGRCQGRAELGSRALTSTAFRHSALSPADGREGGVPDAECINPVSRCQSAEARSRNICLAD